MRLTLRARHAFTLVELIVALTLFAVGVTAWIGTSMAALRLAATAERATTAHQQARSRAELLAAGPCGGMQAGAVAGERWTVQQLSNGIRLIRAEVAYVADRDTRTAVFEMMATC